MTPLIIRSAALPGPRTWLALAAAVGLAFCDYHFQAPTAGMWGALFGLWALIGFLRHPWGKWWEIDGEGLTTADGLCSPLTELQAVVIPLRTDPKRRPKYAINAVFIDRVVSIPARTDVPSHQIYETLREHAPQHPPEEVPEELLAYCNRQIDDFGNDRVWYCGGRPLLGWINVARNWQALGWSLFLIWPIWSTLATYRLDRETDRTVWYPLSGLAFFIGLCFLVISRLIRTRPQKVWGRTSHKNGIVIAPVGIAVSQGDLVGEMAWDEIQRIKYPAIGRGTDGGGHANAIELGIKGAVIYLVDVYDRSLDVIHKRIMQNWRPPSSR